MIRRPRLVLSLLTLVVVNHAAFADDIATDEVVKSVRRLGDESFKVREGAAAALVKLGPPALPALHKALAAERDLEIKTRLEAVVGRIEAAATRDEVERWKDLDAKRRSVRDRLAVLAKRVPDATGRQMTAAVYLLAVGRTPTEAEAKQGEAQLGRERYRPLSAYRLARALVSGKEFAAETAGVNERILKTQRDAAAEADITKALVRLNTEETRKLIDAAGAAVAKAAKGDEDLVDLVFLLTVSRFPNETEKKSGIAHLSRAAKRETAAVDLIWALMNSKEFLGAK